MRDQLDRIVNDSYGRLLAYLAKRSARDIQIAEDALADAFASALRTWERDGVPDHPEAWLLRVARNRIVDANRQAQRAQTHRDQLAYHLSSEIQDVDALPESEIPDERLQMMFACAHPSIDASVRTPLMLQAVLGISSKRMASAFLMSPATLSQRLVRAKVKIRDAGIRLELPEDLDSRSQVVLDAIYAAFAIGWDGCDAAAREWIDAAFSLVEIVAECLPRNAEAAGLRALLLYCRARDESRRNEKGGYVPLHKQMTDRWNHELIDQAEKELCRASRLERTGRYQLEAAIQSAHMQRRQTQQTPWGTIIQLYRALLHISPTIGVHVALAGAFVSQGDCDEALKILDSLDPNEVKDYQPFWAVRAESLRRLDRDEASAAYDRAIGLTREEAIREFLKAQKQEIH